MQGVTSDIKSIPKKKNTKRSGQANARIDRKVLQNKGKTKLPLYISFKSRN